jgi:hypothetical protein
MRKSTAIGLMISIMCVFSGCAENKMTAQRFGMIKEGTSTKDEVRMTLGDKYTALGDQWEYEDEDKHLHATVHFDARGVVVRKEWMDGKTGEWSGAAPGIEENPKGAKQSDSKSYGTIRKD